jgi:hypothetical protein
MLAGGCMCLQTPKKIPDLIAGLEQFAARRDLSPIARALLVHLEFVTIHPRKRRWLLSAVRRSNSGDFSRLRLHIRAA